MAADYLPRPGRAGAPATEAVGVDPIELVRMRDEHCTYMEMVSKEGNLPPGAVAMHDRLMFVLDSVLRGASYRGEVAELIEAAEQFDEWRQDQGRKLSPQAEAIRNRSLDVMHRLASTLPEKPLRTADPDAGLASPAQTMTVEAFAHAIGKSPRTVYRMAKQGQLLLYREGVGRGTVLIYRDQVDPANRPYSPTRAGRPTRLSPRNVGAGDDRAQAKA